MVCQASTSVSVSYHFILQTWTLHMNQEDHARTQGSDYITVQLPSKMPPCNLWQAVAQNCRKSTEQLNIRNLAWPKLAQWPIKLTFVMMSFWQVQCISFWWEVLQAGSAALADTMWNTFDGRCTADALLSMLNAQGSTELDRIKTKNKTLKSVTEPVRPINMDR